MLKNIAESINAQISSHVLNQEALSKLALAAFFAGGHILLTGPTGLGKTTWARAFAGALCVNCSQVRLTNDIRYDEIFGTGQHTGFVIATHEENLVLSESLKDRFMMTLHVNYPGVVAEKQILQMHHVNDVNNQEFTPLYTPEVLIQAKQEVQAVAVEDAIFNYIISIVETTRRVGAVQTGVSIRGSIALLQAAKAYAAINGRDYVELDDVRSLALPVLRHRINLKPDAINEGMQADRIIESIIAGRR